MLSQSFPRNESGVASFILGVVPLITYWLLVGIAFGIAAVLTGDIARKRVQRGEAHNSRVAMLGIDLGTVSIGGNARRSEPLRSIERRLDWLLPPMFGH
ncbi:DUF4190 domain-containing protein [Mycobacterium lepromatosis]|uniref:Uncharacterized protein n=1 Tax=Mycobacterium lepromatosis TaxID=480418 RepID=A0A0F4EPD3_9MYCO|nr:DUF4190 domain-containing protein [Mycobacterium lepromatosis]KJX74748.1 hypothetical protein MLPM_5094 [Mycobacterium lepromatosis]